MALYQARYAVRIEGKSPMLQHSDNLSWAEQITKWRKDPANKKFSTKGDDRSPAFSWLGSLYFDKGLVVCPSDNLMTCIREGGARCPKPVGRGTWKQDSQSGIMVNEIGWPIVLGNGQTIKQADVETLMGEKDFSAHEAKVKELGFELFVKRARIGQSKHVRVRPRFDQWSCEGTLTVLNEAITTEILEDILVNGGCYAGLCDWRPSSPCAPGQFGVFIPTIKKI